MNDDIEAAVISQQKNIKVLEDVSIKRIKVDKKSLREPDLVIGQCFYPVHALEIKFLVTFILVKYLKKMLSFRGAQYTGPLGKVWNEGEDKEGDEDRNETLDYEDPSEPFQSGDTVHIANAVCQYAADARTQGAEAEKRSVSDGHLSASIVLVNQECGPYTCQRLQVQSL